MDRRSALASLLALIPGRPWLEATIEAAPGAITAEKARAWAACGINRVSLGVQSFVEPEIRAHRPQAHRRKPSPTKSRLLRAAGIAQHQYRPDRRPFRADRGELARIARLDRAPRRPRTSRSTCWKWMKTAAWARKSCPAARATARPKRPATISTADFYEMAVERLAALGIHALRDFQFRAARPRIAPQPEILEAGAVRRLRRRRPFLRRARCGGRIRRTVEDISRQRPGDSASAGDRASADERFFVGLRLTAGIRPDAARVAALRRGPSERFLDAGLLETDGGVLRLTNRGVLLSNEVFQEFLTS